MVGGNVDGLCWVIEFLIYVVVMFFICELVVKVFIVDKLVDFVIEVLCGFYCEVSFVLDLKVIEFLDVIEDVEIFVVCLIKVLVVMIESG